MISHSALHVRSNDDRDINKDINPLMDHLLKKTKTRRPLKALQLPRVLREEDYLKQSSAEITGAALLLSKSHDKIPSQEHEAVKDVLASLQKLRGESCQSFNRRITKSTDAAEGRAAYRGRSGARRTLHCQHRSPKVANLSAIPMWFSDKDCRALPRCQIGGPLVSQHFVPYQMAGTSNI